MTVVFEVFALEISDLAKLRMCQKHNFCPVSNKGHQDLRFLSFQSLSSRGFEDLDFSKSIPIFCGGIF